MALDSSEHHNATAVPMLLSVMAVSGVGVGMGVGTEVGSQPMLPELDVNISVVVAPSGMVQHKSGQGATAG